MGRHQSWLRWVARDPHGTARLLNCWLLIFGLHRTHMLEPHQMTCLLGLARHEGTGLAAHCPLTGPVRGGVCVLARAGVQPSVRGATLPMRGL